MPEASGDGVNSVFFANTIFGDSFEEGTLAVTVLMKSGASNLRARPRRMWLSIPPIDSTRTEGQAVRSAYDFHRIVLHEFGHVLGLDHVTFDPPGQALMEPIISDLDHLASDDVAGVRQLYGAEISFLPDSVTLRVGDGYFL